MLRVKVAVPVKLAPRLHRSHRWDQNVPAGKIERLRCQGHIDPSALSCLGFLIDRGLGYFRQGLVGGFFFIKRLLKKGSRISVAQLFSPSA